MENCLIWFRNDLRIKDNPLINDCIKNKYKIIPLYIIDQSDDMGSASKWWLKNSLNSINKSLNNKLLIFADDNKKVLSKLIEQHDISKILWNNRYSKNEINQDNITKKYIEKHGVTVETFHSSLLRNPENTLKKDATPFKVYTPFYKQKYLDVTYETYDYDFSDIKYLDIRPEKENSAIIETYLSEEGWHDKLNKEWKPGEGGAH